MMYLYRFIFIALIFMMANWAAIANTLIKFEIPALSADKSLVLFAQQTNQTLIFDAKNMQSINTTPVVGYYTRQFALKKLLRNSLLQATISSEGYINISHSTIDDAPQTMSTANLSTVGVSSYAKNAENHIEKIAIIGRSSSVRSLTDLSVPVDILEVSMLKRTGQNELGRMLQSIAPSFNFSSSVISDGTDVLRPATLRGLGPDQTLILINGKRRHHASLIHINTSVGRGTAGADINTIPIDAIKHIEILRDGAAAQYGSDAIAGVINIVLKDNDELASITTTVGIYEKGDGESHDVSYNQGTSIFDDGQLNFTIEWREQNATNRSGLHGTCQYAPCSVLADGRFQTNDTREISAPRTTFKIGRPEYKQYTSVLTADYPFKTVELYGFLTASKRDNKSAAFFRHHSNLTANPLLSDGQPLVPGGYLPHITSSIVDNSVNLGIRSNDQHDVWFDVSYTYGKNSIDYRTINSVNPSYANWLESQQNLAADSIRKNIPREANAYGLELSLTTLNVDVRYHLENISFSFGAELRQDSYQVTPGEKYSYFDFDFSIDSNAKFIDTIGGIQGFPGIAPQSRVNERRNVRSFYFEAESELIDNLYATAAVRWDDYDGFDNTSSIKLAANWSFSNDVALRSAISSGFRAPSMQQLYFNNTSTQFLVDNTQTLTPQQVGTFRNDSTMAKALGIPTLTEEASDHMSIGLIYTPVENIMMSLDYYRIDIHDRIILSNKISADFTTELAQLFSQEYVDKAQFFLNGIDTTTKGLDIVATWYKPLHSGQLDVTMAANFTDTHVTKVFAPQNSVLATIPEEQLFAKQDLSIIEAWQPDNRINLNVEYVQQNWLLNLAFNRYGSYTITDGETQQYSPKVLTDIRVEYQIGKQWLLFAGSNNLFDITPDKNKIGNSHAGIIVDENFNTIVESDGVFKYSRRSAPFGFSGRYFYTGVKYQF